MSTTGNEHRGEARVAGAVVERDMRNRRAPGARLESRRRRGPCLDRRPLMRLPRPRSVYGLDEYLPLGPPCVPAMRIDAQSCARCRRRPPLISTVRAKCRDARGRQPNSRRRADRSNCRAPRPLGIAPTQQPAISRVLATGAQLSNGSTHSRASPAGPSPAPLLVVPKSVAPIALELVSPCACGRGQRYPQPAS